MSGLFDPLRVGTLELRNRIMRSATVEMVARKEDGAPVPAMAEMYRALAAGGCALIVTGHTCVEYQGRTNDRMAALATDALIEPWRRTIASAQALGAKVMLQLNHGGSHVDPAGNPDPQSPSGVATNDLAIPRAMTEDDIRRVIASFGQAARRAREAGFDGVQLHGAHGYLQSQFLSPQTNLRDDAWGGDLARRMAFFLAVVDQVRKEVGEDYPVWAKLGVAGDAESGFGPEDGARVAEALYEHGVNAIEVSYAKGVPESLREITDGQYMPLAEAVRRRVGPGRPLALVSGWKSRTAMEDALSSGVIDIVSLSRPLIAEPDLPNKLAAGAEQALCVRCNQCRPRKDGEGVACRNARIQEQLRSSG